MKVNGNDAEPGCWSAGNRGHYGTDRLAEIVEEFGWEFGTVGSPDVEDDPRFWRRAAEAESAEDAAVVRNATGIGSHLAGPDECWDRHAWAADRLEEWLNEHTEGGHWTWEDGEFYLVQTEVVERKFPADGLDIYIY